MERTEGTAPPTGADAPAGERYLLLADISGYTGRILDLAEPASGRVST